MEYLAIILCIAAAGWLLQRRLPAAWQPWTEYFWLGAILGVAFVLVTAPYRLARIANELAHLIG